MAKIPCAVCGEELGLFSGRIKISDGAVCTDCMNSVGISSLSNAPSYNERSIKELIFARQKWVNNFRITKSVETYIHMDENNRLFKIGKDIFAYDNLLSFELLEDGQSIVKGGLGRAVVGGLLFGRVGAVIGGISGGKKSVGICNSMKLRVSLKNAHTDVIYIHFILRETKTNSFSYKFAQDSAQKCIAALETINDANEDSHIEYASNNAQVLSAADEILKFKSLLDQGVITQEEFDAKKSQLLGL